MAFRAADVGFVSDFFSFFFIFMNRIIKNSKTEIHLNDNVTGNYFNLISDLFFFFLILSGCLFSSPAFLRPLMASSHTMTNFLNHIHQ